MFRRLLIYDARASGRRSVRATDQHRGSRTGPARRRARLERRPLAVRHRQFLLYLTTNRCVSGRLAVSPRPCLVTICSVKLRHDEPVNPNWWRVCPRMGKAKKMSKASVLQTASTFPFFSRSEHPRAATAPTSASTTAGPSYFMTVATPLRTMACLVGLLARTGLSFRIRRVEAFTRKEPRSTLLPQRPHTLEKTASHPPGAPSCKKLKLTDN